MRTRNIPVWNDDSIYDSMMAAVIDQRLPPDTRLVEAELCNIYGSVRRNIERVLVRLMSEGVVTMERNRGARVASPTPQEARDVFGLRKVAEREVVRLLSGNLSGPAKQRLAEALELEHAADHNAKDRSRIHHSGDFHVLLAEECGNAEITRLIRRLVARTSLITQLFGNDRALECWHEEHIRLIDLIADGSTEEAAELMTRHLDSIENELRLATQDISELNLEAALIGNISRQEKLPKRHRQKG